jgi:hypothetical protein
MITSKLDGSRHDLPERLYLDAREDALFRIGVTCGEFTRRRLVGEVGDDQAATAISERAADYDLAALDQRAQILQMGWTHRWAQSGALRGIVANDYK